jgi:hypothetical protein
VKSAAPALLAAILCACGVQDRVAGNGSETTTGVSARVLGVDGAPVPGARVQARPSSWIPDSAGGFDPVREAVAGADGVAHLDGLPQGSWSLVATGPDGKALAVLDGGTGIAVDLRLGPVASVQGRVDPAACPSAWVSVAGLGTRTHTGDSGSFTLDSLPTGVLVLQAVSDSGRATRASRSVLATAGASIQAGTLVPRPREAGSGWTDSVRLDLDLGGTRPDTLTGYPLLVRLADSSVDFSKTRGTDLRFTHGSTVLAHQVESWDPVAHVATVWVRLDTVLAAATSLTLVLRYGGTDLPDWSDAGAVFQASEGWVGVWHLDAVDPGADAAGGHRAADFHTLDAPGLAGRGRWCDTGWLRTPDAPDLHLQTLTLSCWARRHGSQIPVGKLLSKGNLDDWHNTWALQDFDSTARIGFLSVRTDSVPDTLRAPTAPADGAWSHLATTWDASTGREILYQDGAAVDSSIQTRPLDYANIPPSDMDLFLGANFIGTLDEVRIARFARSRSWIALDHATQSPSSISLRFTRLP